MIKIPTFEEFKASKEKALNEAVFKLMYKDKKDIKFKQVVEMLDLDSLIKKVPLYQKQLTKDYGIKDFDFIIVDGKKIVWSSDESKTSKFAMDNKLNESINTASKETINEKIDSYYMNELKSLGDDVKVKFYSDKGDTRFLNVNQDFVDTFVEWSKKNIK